MNDSIKKLTKVLEEHYKKYALSDKAKVYLNAFYDKKIQNNTIKAKVEGNYGTYTVSFKLLKSGILKSYCTCYIGEGCKHTDALAKNFLSYSHNYKLIEPVHISSVKKVTDLKGFLETTTLEELINTLKKKKITQTDFAEAINMTSQYVGRIKSGEKKGKIYKELGAVKVAALWMLDNIKKIKSSKTTTMFQKFVDNSTIVPISIVDYSTW